MAVIETWLRQDLNRLVSVQSLQGQVFSLDNSGNLIGVRVTKDGEPVALAGTVTGYCILSDGQTVNVTGSGNAGIQNGNEAYIVIPQLAYSVPGQISIVIKLTQNSTITTLAACTGYVYRSRTDNEVVPAGTPIPDLSTLEEAIANANAATTRANTAAAEAENVNASMSKSGDVITITVTDRDGVTTTETLSDQSEAVEELQNAIVTKAEKNGHYSDMTVGTAEQLVSDEGVTDAEPYLYRKSGGGVEVGNREKLEKIIGGTVAWNQLAENGNFASASGWTYSGNTISVANNEITLTTDGTNPASIIYRSGKFPVGHKVLTSFKAKGNVNSIRIRYPIFKGWNITDNYLEYATIGTVTDEEAVSKERFSIQTVDNVATAGHIVTIKEAQIFDLTQMFGSTIADYIYSLEQATAGAGVAWFRKLFPADYYPYNAGELISVSGLSEHKMIGFNLWDEEWEVGSINDQTGENNDGGNFNYYKRSKNYIKCLPNTNYYFKNESKLARVLFYDSDKHIISFSVNPQNTVITTPQNAFYMRVRSADSVDMNDICINFSDPSRNGEYEPYEKHSYSLDSSLTLRGIQKLDSENKLYYDGDEYTPDGEVTRRYGIVDLGTLNWTRNASGTNPVFVANMNDKKVGANFVCMYPNQGAMENADLTTILNNKACATHVSVASVFCIRDDSYTDAAAFKTAMSGVMLVYELATPTTEQSTPYNPIQVVDPYGTEEFVSTSIVPVGHSTKYLEDSVKKLEDTVRKLNDNVITESAGPTSVVSIKDGADGMPLRDLSVAVEPVQDLHGYDHPWPAGGGKNLLDESDKSIVTTANGASITYDKTSGIMLKAGNSYTFSITGITSSPNGIYFRKLADDSSVATAYNNDSVTATITEDVVVYGHVLYNQGQTQDAWRNIKAQIELGSTATAWTPYSNICPITGWTGAKVTRTGKNLLNPTLVSGTSAGLTATKQSDNSYKVTGAANSAAVNVWIKGQWITDAATQLDTYKIMFLKAGTIITYKDCKLFFYDIETRKMNQTFGINQVPLGSAVVTLTIPRDSWLTGVRIPDAVNGETYDMTVYPQIELGSTATDYEPYQGETYDIAFPTEAGTVYGGTLDVTNGELTVTKVYVSNFARGNLDSTGLLYKVAELVFGAPITGSYAHIMSNIYPGATLALCRENARNGIKSICAYGTAIYIGGYVGNEAALDALLPALVAVYDIVAAITIQLTPTEIRTLLGTNNIWADTGDTTIEYPADTKLYIDNKITQAIAAALNA